MEKDAYTISAIADALRILEYVASQNGQLTLSEIAREADFNKSKVFRILHTFEALGYVQKTSERGHYALGATMVDLGSIALERHNLPAIARPQMRRLLEKFGETVFLAILDGVNVHHLEILESTHRIRISPSAGIPNAPHRTSLGKAILAHLPDKELATRLREIDFAPGTPNSITGISDLHRELEAVRKLGFAIDDEESEIGVRCVGAPILDSKGYPVAAMSVEAPTDRLSDERMFEIGYDVVSATQACSRILGYTIGNDASERSA